LGPFNNVLTASFTGRSPIKFNLGKTCSITRRFISVWPSAFFFPRTPAASVGGLVFFFQVFLTQRFYQISTSARSPPRKTIKVIGY
jgi:hypothetical protein